MNRLCVVAVLLAASPAAAQRIKPWKGESVEAEAGAHASLTPDGPWLPVALAKSAALEVHDATTARPRFLEQANGTRLLFYVEPAKLAMVTRSAAVLAPSRDKVTTEIGQRTPGMKLRAGTKLDEVGPDDNGHTKVRLEWLWSNGSLVIEGWVVTDKIATVYKSAAAPLLSFEPDVTVPGNYELLDAPGGKPFVFSKGPDRIEVMTLSRKGKHTLVRTGHGAVGWIATRHTRKITRDDAGLFGVEGGVEAGALGCTPCRQPTLPRHTPLYAAIDGAWIGEVDDEFMLEPAERDGDWLRFDVDTRFGKVAVWAKQPAVRDPPKVSDSAR
jgi:hypothetical protein